MRFDRMDMDSGSWIMMDMDKDVTDWDSENTEKKSKNGFLPCKLGGGGEGEFECFFSTFEFL